MAALSTTQPRERVWARRIWQRIRPSTCFGVPTHCMCQTDSVVSVNVMEVYGRWIPHGSDTSTASDLGHPMASLKPKSAIQSDGPANAVKVFSATSASQDDPFDQVSSAGDDFAALCERPFSRLSCGLVTDESLPAWMVGNHSSPSTMSCLPPKPHPLISSWVQAKPSSIDSLTRETTETVSPGTSLPLPD